MGSPLKVRGVKRHVMRMDVRTDLRSERSADRQRRLESGPGFPTTTIAWGELTMFWELIVTDTATSVASSKVNVKPKTDSLASLSDPTAADGVARSTKLLMLPPFGTGPSASRYKTVHDVTLPLGITIGSQLSVD